MLSGTALDAVIATLPVTPLNTVLCRAVTNAALHDPRYNPDPLYCQGAVVSGARFTPVGGPASLYFAEDKETAWAEVHQAFDAVRRVSPADAFEPPTVVYYARLELQRVLDITDPAIQTALSTNPGEMASSWVMFQALKQKAPTQELGETVHRTNSAQAIRYLSTPGTTKAGQPKYCYVIFCDLIAPGYIEVIDPSGKLGKRLP